VEKLLDRPVKGQTEEQIRIKEEEEEIDELNKDKEFHNAIPSKFEDESDGNDADVAGAL
jgi:hypothetical protein